MEMMMEMEAGREMNAAMKMETAETIMERLATATELLEKAVVRLVEQGSASAAIAEAGVERIVATVESRREGELEQRIASLEVEIAELRAGAAVHIPAEVTNGRKTLPVAMATLLAKQEVQMESVEPAALDAALASLSVEQRIAVKSQLLRAGLVS